MKPEIIERFGDILQYPVQEFMSGFVNFTRIYANNILDYYQGNTAVPDMESFTQLAYLLQQSHVIEELVVQKQYQFDSYGYYELCEQLDDIKTKLEGFDNASRWCRSSITKNSYSSVVQQDFVLRSQQTIESLSREVGQPDWDNQWVDIATKNDLTEEEYTPAGGNILKYSFQSNLKLFIETVVDNIAGQTVYGKDFDKKITFEDDDLKVLSYRKTIEQAVYILLNLRKGDSPEFPQDGIQSNLVVGGNMGNVTLPVIFKQIAQTFSKDDTLKSLQILDFKKEEDKISLSCQIETRLGEVVPQLVVL
ncbi:MAG: hypothetical protein UV42_C0073G0002 [Candidatus Magasanikbacteria bacterium GW2011_GWE2_42_7]|uniref:Uncharacterized protein n=1 Tax=Candidatus Magasanikbacteria bacterium GW2011_GWE2_42_7 TaxID=1619052 RepID=A0A0G1E5U1_9BACT|nr:MAG: hypothetical protein UV42_C0073G0002 [Candidatus Magasanikbacteria bacterium GW2011_GWE2_42_7]